MSQKDLKFLSRLRENITQNGNGHYEMPLPFKEERPKLQNKTCTLHCLNCLESTGDDIISHGDAEKVPEDETDNSPASYIPHHGIYHPQKPGKIWVVFDCSAKYQETSLNDIYSLVLI